MRRTRTTPTPAGVGALAGGVLMKLAVLLVVLFAALALAWMLFLPVLFTSRVEERTGFPATVGVLVANPFRGTVEVRDFVLRNPETFATREFLRVREFRVAGDVSALFSARPAIDEMVIDVERVTIVSRGAETNAQRFEQGVYDVAKPGDGLATRPGETAGRVAVKHLHVRLDEIVTVSEAGGELRRETRRAGIDASYSNVADLSELLAEPALRPLRPALMALGGLFPGEMGAALSETAAAGADILKDAGRRTGEAVKGFFETLEESKKP